MAAHIPEGGISLRGAAEDTEKLKQGSRSAILFRLNDDILRDLKKTSHAKEGLQFVTGSNPVSSLYCILSSYMLTHDRNFVLVAEQ